MRAQAIYQGYVAGKIFATPEQAFDLLRGHLTTHHLTPTEPQDFKAPGIARTRSS